MEGLEDVWPRLYYFYIPMVIQSLLFSITDRIKHFDINISTEQY